MPSEFFDTFSVVIMPHFAREEIAIRVLKIFCHPNAIRVFDSHERDARATIAIVKGTSTW